jgi:thiol-disulfide isomerase/thioredoxin
MSEPRQPVPTPASDPAPLKLASTVPTFTLTDREGRPRTLNDWSGRSLIVNFWATWCAPCRREIPLLSKLQRDHGAEGFQVIGIAVDFREDVLKFADDIRMDYPVLIGEQDALDAAAAFGIDAVGFPFTIFSDRHGRIVTAHTGELTASQAEVIWCDTPSRRRRRHARTGPGRHQERARGAPRRRRLVGLGPRSPIDEGPAGSGSPRCF